MARFTGTERAMVAALILVGLGTVYLVITWLSSGATGDPASPGGFATLTALSTGLAIQRARRTDRRLRSLEIAILLVLAGLTIAVGAVAIAIGNLGDKIFSGALVAAMIATIVAIRRTVLTTRAAASDDHSEQTRSS